MKTFQLTYEKPFTKSNEFEDLVITYLRNKNIKYNKMSCGAERHNDNIVIHVYE